MTNLEIVEKAAKEIFKAETPEQIEHFTKFLTFLLMGQVWETADLRYPKRVKERILSVIIRKRRCRYMCFRPPSAGKPVKCPECGSINPAIAKNCVKCKTDLTPVKEAPKQ